MIVEHNQSSFYDNAFKFNGKELDDATGMYYYGARYYDPRISIFVSVDPLAEQTMEPYLYTGNNPIMFTDPTGMSKDHIVGPQGNKLDISIVNNKIEYGNDVPENIVTVLNEMWRTEDGQKQVAHLLNTRAAITMEVSENVGAYYVDGKYYGVYGSTGPTKGQSTKMIEDYDGGKVYEENTIIMFKGTYEYGIGDNSKINEGKVTIIDPTTGKDISSKRKDKFSLEPSQNPDKIYKNETEFYNLTGTHEAEHTKSGNIKLQRRGHDAEGPAYEVENRSRNQL